MEPPIRILQVVGGLDPGGTETWLLHVLRHIDRSRFKMDFLVHTYGAGRVCRRSRRAGCRVIPCLGVAQPWRYARNLHRIFHQYGPWDVVHSHVNHFSGFVLRQAAQAGVPLRIAHSHSDNTLGEAGAGFMRRRYLALMKQWLARFATVRLAVSHLAGQTLFDPFDASGESWQTLYAAIDLAPFRSPADPRAARAAVGLPGDAFVLGHVGRFAAENHAFLVQVAAEVARREPRTHLLLIGDGPLRPAIMQQVADAGLGRSGSCLPGCAPMCRACCGRWMSWSCPRRSRAYPWSGWKPRPPVSRGWPRIWCPSKVWWFPALVQRLPLHLPAAAWAEALLAARASISQPEALALLEHSPFNIRVSVAALERIYADARTMREARTGYARA